MTLQLRPYRLEAVDKTIEWVKTTTTPCLVEMSVGAGKSIYIAEVARQIHQMSGKRILCLAPRSELVVQNHAKYKALGLEASIYSASAKQKSLRHPVIFATPMTFRPVARRMGGEFAAIIIDECEGTTGVIVEIIEMMKEGNQNLRVIGTTGTPFTTTGGYVYRMDEDGKTLPDTLAKDPYYVKKLHTVTTRQLLDLGYLTPAVVGETGRECYDSLSLKPNKAGRFKDSEVNDIFVGHGRKTAMITADAMDRMKDRQSIVFFAATIKHAEEIHASFHPDAAAVVHGGIKNRDKILEKFSRGDLRVLINVNVLTVGWDCPRVDGIVLMRATESARLLAQIIGRGLRLYPGKDDVILLDYAKNFERHAEDGDIFNPSIKAQYSSGGLGTIEAECEQCGYTNTFSPRPNDGDWPIDKHGYFTDLDGNRIKNNDGKEIPAHFGRRCCGVTIGKREPVRCGYFWSCKICPHCEADNDIAARYCSSCKAELINPNDKLIADFKALKRSPNATQTDEVLQMDVLPTTSQKGERMVRVEFITAARKFAVFFMPESKSAYVRTQWTNFEAATGGNKPRTVTYKKEDSGFYRVLDVDQPTDKERLDAALAANLAKAAA